MYDIFLRLLAERGVTTADVCKATGISQSTLSNWKKRNNVLSSALLGKIAEYFDVSIDYMMGKETEKIHTTKSTIISGNAGVGKSSIIKKLTDILTEELDGSISFFPEKDDVKISDEAKQFALAYDQAPEDVKQMFRTWLKYSKPAP